MIYYIIDVTIAIIRCARAHFSQRSSREAGKGCGYEARAEKHPEALTESLFNRLPVSMLRMFFKRNDVDAMLNGFVAGRL